MFLTLVALWCLVALLTGCNNREPSVSGSESGPTVRIEDTSFPPNASSSGTETSKPDIVSEEPPKPIASTAPEFQIVENESNEKGNSEMKMNVKVNDQNFTATLERNSAVDAFVQMMKRGAVTLQLRDYSGFEKVGPLGRSLPASDSQTTTRAGDIVLYQGNQIVLFYGSNSWSYTRLGHIDNLTGWKEALGGGDISVTFSLED